MTPGRRALLGSALFTLCTAALADCRDKECELPASWNEFTAVTLTFSEGDSKAATWRASGAVENYKAGAVTFDLTLTVPAQTPTAKTATGTLNFKGRLSMRTEPVFRENASLDGWTVYGVGGQAPQLKTIADLRKIIAEKRRD